MAHGERAANNANWGGRDYWKPRHGNGRCAGYRDKSVADANSIKRMTRRTERRLAKNALKNPVMLPDSLPLKMAM